MLEPLVPWLKYSRSIWLVLSLGIMMSKAFLAVERVLNQHNLRIYFALMENFKREETRMIIKESQIENFNR